MSKLSGFFLAAAAVILISGAAEARDSVLPAVNLPVITPVTPAPRTLKEPATAQARISPAGYTDYDAFSAVNDPLYREGSRELLKQAVKDGAPVKAAPKQELRDAPISKGANPARILKRVKIKKPVHADPVKEKSTL